MANKAAKGAAWERQFCKELSLWWTNGKRDDVFWRTSNSGGRATVRGQQGKATANSYGDVMAVDSSGQPLLDRVTIELKRGYNRHTIQDLIDGEKSVYGEWINKIRKCSQEANTPGWIIVVKRDRRKPIVIMSEWLRDIIYVTSGLICYISSPNACDKVSESIAVCCLSNFFDGFTLKMFKSRSDCGP